MPTLTLTRPETEARLILDGTPSAPVSIGTNDKIGCPGFSKAPVRDCARQCAVCAKDCYALKAYRQYPSTRTAWDANGDVMRTNPYGGVAYIHAWLERKRVKPSHFRIHVSGDLLSQDELDAWATLATAHPETLFYGYTKNSDLDYRALPLNLTFRFSAWQGLTTPVGAPTFHVMWGDERDASIPADATPCEGDCKACGYLCANPAVTAVYVHAH